jgi:N-acetylglutamate synthase-like GNAT family acetyltransferase
MQIRAATAADIPAIIDLLKVSLGESLMPKSEAFWRWKHIENPFGISPVLVGIEQDEIIGVRAFMRWRWESGSEVLHAVRAVDTATHPKYQGKGIFKKLTLELVNQCEAAGIHFIYNTPNANSKPGYLKMGWTTLGRMKIYVRPLLYAKTKAEDFDAQYAINKMFRTIELPAIVTPSQWQTPVSFDFLNWRYIQNPNVQYYFFSDDPERPTYVTVFRLKPGRLGTEFRICFSMVEKDSESRHGKHVMAVARAAGARFITSVTPLSTLMAKVSAGPEVTIRSLSALPEIISFNNWLPALGDMELF